MQKSEALSFLRAQLPVMTERFDVKQLAIFGSTARDEAAADSDLDLLVEFKHPENLTNFCGLKNYLEENLSVMVDMGTFDTIRQELKSKIMKDAIYVA
ncbi:MAG: nucleotidyltransferase family protein [Candidatus Symbiobacter sp.]|nr:nucleotidyltransferase family protein [Candidatus Symbiobacter sp.]